ncbi:MAG: hypothetical protein COB02_08625 [Candidatus Cloacimonadota bacterium]|nr:MAG: hypothetical protein COB02_08625 [Candidatus Cloacimonadota bacterium]
MPIHILIQGNKMIQKVIKSLSSDLIEVQKIINHETSQCHSKLLQEILDHTFHVKGKLLRPILHLACCHLIETKDKSSFHKIAAGLEILHTASLIHDDIIDNGELRRGIETVHKKWGLAEATLLGDWLLSKSFHIITHNNPNSCNTIMSQLTCELVEGQYLEIEYNQQSAQTLSYIESQYLKMIDLKTGSIFRAACNLAIVCHDSFTPKQIKSLNQYASDFGTLFQIVDDLIDFDGDSNYYGKTTGYDVINGLITLPVMNAIKYQEKNGQESSILNAFNQKNYNFLKSDLKTNVFATNAIETTISSIHQLKNKCFQNLECFNDNLGKNILEDLVSYTISRIPNSLTL